jgi:ribosome-associated toxin RatA of RatAB toxin-antitoxin module
MGLLIEKQQRHGRSGYGSVIVDLAASPLQVYDVLSDIESYHRLIRTIKSVHVYNTLDNTKSAEFCLSRFLLKINVIHTFDRSKV